MKRSQAFPSVFLAKDDLMNGPRIVTIKEVRMELVRGDGGEEEKPVMHFEPNGTNTKPLILNNINWMTIEESYGDESDHWISKPLELFVDPAVMFGGRRVGGVRVRVPDVWLFDRAVQECARVNITKEQLIEHLKAKGRNSYSSVKDTAEVKALIRARQQPAGAAAGGKEEVAF